MDSTKLIIGILIVVYFVVKTIIGDAKKERNQKNTPQKPKTPTAEFPSFFYEDEPQHEEPQKDATPAFMREGQSVTSSVSVKPMEMEPEMSEAEQQAHAERWRRAVIDSEILKTKF